jgi:hypothetical protein
MMTETGAMTEFFCTISILLDDDDDAAADRLLRMSFAVESMHFTVLCGGINAFHCILHALNSYFEVLDVLEVPKYFSS